MISACKARLVTALTAAAPAGAGIAARSVFTEAAKGRQHKTVPKAVVLTGAHKLTPDGVLVSTTLTDGDTMWALRRRTWQVVLQLGVVLYAPSEDTASELVIRVTQHLGSGFTADGDWVALNRVLPSWLDLPEVEGKATHSRASLLAGQTGVVIGYEFVGGVYETTKAPRVPSITTHLQGES